MCTLLGHVGPQPPTTEEHSGTWAVWTPDQGFYEQPSNQLYPLGAPVERDIKLQGIVMMKMIIPKQDKVKRLLLLQLNAQVPEEEDQKSL